MSGKYGKTSLQNEQDKEQVEVWIDEVAKEYEEKDTLSKKSHGLIDKLLCSEYEMTEDEDDYRFQIQKAQGEIDTLIEK